MKDANEGNKEDREEGTNNGDEEGKCEVEVKCTLLQALRLCTGRTAHRGSSLYSSTLS